MHTGYAHRQKREIGYIKDKSACLCYHHPVNVSVAFSGTLCTVLGSFCIKQQDILKCKVSQSLLVCARITSVRWYQIWQTTSITIYCQPCHHCIYIWRVLYISTQILYKCVPTHKNWVSPYCRKSTFCCIRSRRESILVIQIWSKDSTWVIYVCNYLVWVRHQSCTYFCSSLLP